MTQLIEKLESKTRLTYEDGVKLWELDLFTLGKFADRIRREKNGNNVFFNHNRHINPTNICADSCKFCAFSANRKNPNAYEMTHEEILEQVRAAVARGVKEFHIVSAHSPNKSWQWYLEIFRLIKSEFPQAHIKALTAAEVDFLSRKFGFSYEELIDKMIEYGVDSMPGGGAEIFDEQVRRRICGGKVGSKEWLQIHALWHAKGRQSNATMLFGHLESRENRVDHILRLRAVQDESLKRGNGGGFNAFIPLVFQRQNNYLKVEGVLGSEEILKTFAVARILLDNFTHIKSYWATTTLNLALVAQNFGADDLDGTIEVESIQSAAGAKSRGGVSVKEFIDLIQTSGFIAVERDSLYNVVTTY